MYYEIYTKDDCPYCNLAKATLRNVGATFTEKKLYRDFTKEQLKEKFPSAKTFPIIVLDGFVLGGYTEMKEHLNQQSNSSKILLNE